ncbi:hypothetical protein OOT46_17770 [Aquabacterium sp. A7-Y]|uniref:hypothetical protein n=1 Tax=Aquabacterium sp. A7-Y TaxID=1349605 RepID=UPI00223E8D83|nr:hypothetical protein [Aquabacterium sp. A7-Y]MCW7539689.1 hypothetical protein [Aquabacterium sp. A7-Y]
MPAQDDWISTVFGVNVPVKSEAGVFTIHHTLFTNAEPGADIQFGMDFTVSSSVGRPLCQLIFPSVAVGTNVPGRWNVDNHAAAGTAASLIFANASGGVLVDKPREIAGRDTGIKRTKFAVYLVDVQNNSVQTKGIHFSYSINTNDATPQTIFEGASRADITNEHKSVMLQRCPHLTFVP